jgi:hypothetical protein
MTARTVFFVGLVVCVVARSGLVAGEKPTLDLRASPQVAFSPARIVLTGELKNVQGLDEQLYCPTVVWEWGDGTQSMHSSDCEPFQPGTSELKLRYIQEHRFQTPGRFRVVLKLQKGTQVVLSGSTVLTVREGGNPYAQ